MFDHFAGLTVKGSTTTNEHLKPMNENKALNKPINENKTVMVIAKTITIKE